MGTRGITGFVVGGEVKATYQQYDSYPEGVGLDVLNFVRELVADPAKLDTARQQAAELREVTGDPTAEDRERFAYLHDGHVSTGTDWYSLLRKAQGNPAEILKAGVFEQSTDFANDSLFCEWAWLVNFDDRTLECFHGFQDDPHQEGRFAGPEGAGPNDNGRYPIRLVQTISWDALPEDKAFVELFKSGDEDDDD